MPNLTGRCAYLRQPQLPRHTAAELAVALLLAHLQQCSISFRTSGPSVRLSSPIAGCVAFTEVVGIYEVVWGIMCSREDRSSKSATVGNEGARTHAKSSRRSPRLINSDFHFCAIVSIAHLSSHCVTLGMITVRVSSSSSAGPPFSSTISGNWNGNSGSRRTSESRLSKRSRPKRLRIREARSGW